MKRITYLILVLLIAAACKEVFEAPPQSLLHASFVNSATDKAITSKISAIGIGQDSLWIYETNMDEILLPLSSNDTSSYIISFDSTIDTISFIHETTLKYASMESGFFHEYKLNSIDFTHNRIDSIQITDSLVTQNWHENIKLYIRPLPVVAN